MTATARQKDREAEVLRLCAERGLTVERFGRGWRIFGGGVDVLVTKLAYLTEDALRPRWD